MYLAAKKGDRISKMFAMKLTSIWCYHPKTGATLELCIFVENTIQLQQMTD
jgi:hypothetical protein